MSLAILEKEAVRLRALGFSVEQYHQMGRLGKIPEKTELLEGVIIEKMPKDPLHASMVSRLFAFLQARISANFMLRQENPLTLGTSEPEPDLAVVDRRDDWYQEAHPVSAHLVIEVANTTLHLDREKAAIYARAGLPEYWLVNLADFSLEAYREASDEGYRYRRIFSREESITPLFAPDISLSLDELLHDS